MSALRNSEPMDDKTGYTTKKESISDVEAGDPYLGHRNGRPVDADRLSQLSELGRIERSTTHRGLKSRHVSMIAIGGAVGVSADDLHFRFWWQDERGEDVPRYRITDD